MALQLEIKLDNGIELPQAYLSVNKVEFTYTDINELSVELSVFKDVVAYEASRPEITKFNYRCSGIEFDTYFSLNILNMENRNPLVGIYEWLKSMPNFSSAEDV